jgi:sulfur carrier protein
MKVELRNPPRTVEYDDAMSVARLLNRLGLNRESVLVICDGTLVPHDAVLDADATVEIRNVISGGAR